nr:protein ino4 [Quercus suber]
MADSKQARLTDAQKKANHIDSERKRREAIREGFDRLSEIVPGMGGQGRSEAVVLQHTVQYLMEEQMKREKLKTVAMSRGMTEQEFEEVYRKAGEASKAAQSGTGSDTNSNSGTFMGSNAATGGKTVDVYGTDACGNDQVSNAYATDGNTESVVFRRDGSSGPNTYVGGAGATVARTERTLRIGAVDTGLSRDVDTCEGIQRDMSTIISGVYQSWKTFTSGMESRRPAIEGRLGLVTRGLQLVTESEKLGEIRYGLDYGPVLAFATASHLTASSAAAHDKIFRAERNVLR